MNQSQKQVMIESLLSLSVDSVNYDIGGQFI